MKIHARKLFAMLLVLGTLVSFAIPAVFAADGDVSVAADTQTQGFPEGGIAADNLAPLFKTSAAMITQVNGHDYMAFCVYGGTMLIYDLDEWRLVDEVFTGISTPRAITEDPDGNWWITGTNYYPYCYNPYTQTGSLTKIFLDGADTMDITTGDDGYLYCSRRASFGAATVQINPKTHEHKEWRPAAWNTYQVSIAQKGDYIYAGAHGDSRHEVWKIDKNTGEVVGSLPIGSDRMPTLRYFTRMDFLDENYLFVVTQEKITVVDVRTMELLPDEKIGLKGNVKRSNSSSVTPALDGKKYFVTDAEGVCYYDLETQTFGAVGGELASFTNPLWTDCVATIEDSRLSETSIITYGAMGVGGLDLIALNLETKDYVTLIGLVDSSFGTGQVVNTLGMGLPGTNEIYIGVIMPDTPAQVYNTETKELTRTFSSLGQNDYFYNYKGVTYIGNYTGCMLTQMTDSGPVSLFRLNDDNFNQARLHAITGGDDKLFVGTIPDVYNFGGLLAWYDLETELTYVVTGPNPEDVFYAKASKIMATNEWYSAVTKEKVDIKAEWDKDQDGDGNYEYFQGPVPMKAIVKVVYSDGLLYGIADRRGGSSTVDVYDVSSELFIYDVENMRMLNVFDISDYIEGMKAPVQGFASLELDPDDPNKLWGVVSETLFSMTYDKATNKVSVKEELSFSYSIYNDGNFWHPKPIYFDGDEMYVQFWTTGGLCRVNRKDPSKYEQLLGNFKSENDIPIAYIITDDGYLYYLKNSSTSLYVLNLNMTDEDRAAAKTLRDTIDTISDNPTTADLDAIRTARALYDAMDPGNHALVSNYDKLVSAEIALLQQRVDNLSEVTLEDEAELASIRNTYLSLPLTQRENIAYNKVSNAESKISILRGQRTSALIDALGEITLEKEQQIRDARASFMALSRYEKTLVTNINVLEAAEAKLTGLLLGEGDGNVVTYVVVAVVVVLCAGFGVVCAIPTTRNKIFKKKVKTETTEE